MDGTGIGLDGQVWGGEWLVADLQGFQRAAWLEPLPLPGGDAGIRNPGRVAVAYLHRLFGDIPALPFVSALTEAEVRTVRIQVERGINLAMTSSSGRLFDVVAAMAGGLVRATFEAQAAIEMEMVSEQTKQSYPFDLCSNHQVQTWGNGKELPGINTSQAISLKPLLKSIIHDVQSEEPFSKIGGKFHRTLARMIATVSQTISGATGIRKVALSGGCFQNRLLLRMTVEELHSLGLHPLVHLNVPSNDGCISLGQAAIGHFALKDGRMGSE
jgi:hydrogenase maturation protein HypF